MIYTLHLFCSTHNGDDAPQKSTPVTVGVKVKLKFTLELAMKALSGRRGSTVLVLQSLR
jgi:hypothetical protein